MAELWRTRCVWQHLLHSAGVFGMETLLLVQGDIWGACKEIMPIQEEKVFRFHAMSFHQHCISFAHEFPLLRLKYCYT